MKLLSIYLGLAFTNTLTATLNSGGGRTTIGTYTNTGSIGSPFATGVRTVGPLVNRTGLIEILFPTHALPPESDLDMDGLPNAWETVHGFDPGAANNPATDTDQDGLTDLQEYIAGTNPRSPASRFAVASIAETTGIRLEFNTIPGRLYRIETSTDLATWTTVEDIPGDGSLRTLFQPFASAPQGRSFYRIRILITPP